MSLGFVVTLVTPSSASNRGASFTLGGSWFISSVIETRASASPTRLISNPSGSAARGSARYASHVCSLPSLSSALA